MINIENTSICPPGTAYALTQDDKQTVILKCIQGSKLVQYTANNTRGVWKNLQWVKQEIECFDSGFINMTGAADDTVVHYELLILHKDGIVKIIKLPQTNEIYSLKTPYRLWHSYDTKRTYQNIADSWQLIATLHHDELLEAGEYSHAEIDTILKQLNPESIQALIQQVQDLMTTVSGLSLSVSDLQSIINEFVVEYPPTEGGAV